MYSVCMYVGFLWFYFCNSPMLFLPLSFSLLSPSLLISLSPFLSPPLSPPLSLQGCFQTLKLLLAKTVNFRVQDVDGRTPLHLATAQNNIRVGVITDTYMYIPPSHPLHLFPSHPPPLPLPLSTYSPLPPSIHSPVLL